MHAPLFQIFPPIFEKCSDSVLNFRTCTLFRKISRFSSAKIYDDLFLVIDQPQISNFPHYFASFSTFSPLFCENYYSPTFTNFPPVFKKFTCFLRTFRVFRFSPTLTMMHLCITQCTYWTPLIKQVEPVLNDTDTELKR